MKKADIAKKRLEETFLLHSVGEKSASTIEDALHSHLESLGYAEITCQCAFVQSGGVLVRFTGPKGNTAVALFYVDENGDSVVTTIPEEADDKTVTVELSAMNPEIDDDLSSPDLTRPSFLNKSTVRAILDSGNIRIIEDDGTVSPLPTPVTSHANTAGDSKRYRGINPLKNDSGYFKKLPKVKVHSEITDKQKECRSYCKQLGWISK